MRNELCAALVARAEDERFVLLTGDLGFMALEPLQEILGDRFINAGIAEQNMVSVAAGLAREGLLPSVYSIAPFIYARAFEQIRNDVALHGLSVSLIGNGGGFGYGVMGPTHHALEDYGVLLTLSGIKIFVPIFGTDVVHAVTNSSTSHGPSYVRLGRDEAPHLANQFGYAAVRKLTSGSGQNVVVSVGPLAGLLARQVIERSLDVILWGVSELPLVVSGLPEAMVSDLSLAHRVVLIEEHVRHGGFGVALLADLATSGIRPVTVSIVSASSNHSGSYGSQEFLRGANGLTIDNVIEELGLV